ncbi:MAG: triacylglycerol lipase [Odoribacter sp. 43_10]|nr:MAG: triacylglycerol lipase [Odoribacter sp. 43_10]
MKRVRICNFGRIMLKLFCFTTVILSIYLLLGFFGLYQTWFGGPEGLKQQTSYWLIRLGIVILLENIIFWTGIITVYLTSEQLGIRWRVLGVVCGWIPVVHLIMLHVIIKTTGQEVKMEKMRAKRNKKRAKQEICRTKYPLLMVHGVFFRDFEHLNYWGRIPEELEKNGARIYYGNHNSASAVRDSAEQLAARVHEIIDKTGCEKVNIIAHSKGGLDSRAMIALTDAAPYVASLTTINTPHRGCQFADYLLNIIPAKQQKAVEKAYNAGAAKLGDVNPDFLAAVHDLTFENCEKLNEEIVDDPNIFYQSVGSKLNKPMSGRFPLNFTYPLVKYFDGANDGLVGEESFPWGENYQFLTVEGKRGISHGDVIDLNRENIPGFDVREFYVQLVADLKNKGL